MLSWNILYSFSDISGLRINGKSDNDYDSDNNDDDNDCLINKTEISYDDSGNGSSSDSNGYMKFKSLDLIQILINSCWIHIDANDVKDADNLFI